MLVTKNKKITALQEFIYIAVVDITSQETEEATEGKKDIYVYKAKLHFKQSTPANVTAHAKDTEYTNDIANKKYYATKGFVTLISLWDLALAGTDTVSVPCVNRGKHFENIASIPGATNPDTLVQKLEDSFGKSIDLREVEVDEETASSLEIFGFAEGEEEEATLQELVYTEDSSEVERYSLLVRIKDADERPRIGYLGIKHEDSGTISTPKYVLGKDEDGVIGWVATCTHESQHPES